MKYSIMKIRLLFFIFFKYSVSVKKKKKIIIPEVIFVTQFLLKTQVLKDVIQINNIEYKLFSKKF